MSITLRNIKGSELTFQEVDVNFSSLFYSSSLDGNVLNLHYVNATSGELSQSIDLSTISPENFTGSLLLTSSVDNNTLTFTKGDGSSFPITVKTGSIEDTLITASVSSNVITFTKGDGDIFTITIDTGSTTVNADTASFITASNVHGPYGRNSVISSSFSISSSYALSAFHAQTSDLSNTSSYITGSNVYGPFGSNSVISSSFAISSSYALSGSYALSSSFAETASYVESAQTASHILADNVIQPFTNLTASSNISASGYISSSIFSGNGSELTSGEWNVGYGGPGKYNFSGTGLSTSEANPALYLTRGEKFKIKINAAGHPFYIQTVEGAYDASKVYSTGVTNNGVQVGTLEFNIPYNAPTELWYVCQFHSNMNGPIYIANAINHSGSFSGSFEGNGSGLTGVISSSYASTSSLALENVITASVSSNTITFTKGDDSTFSLIVDTGSTALPGGSPNQIQFNDAGSFNGDPRLIFKKSNGLVQLSGSFEITGSSDSNAFLIKSASLETFKVDNKGIAVFGDLPYTPSAVEGGLIFSGSNFWVGL